jgi:hypothetical protein
VSRYLTHAPRSCGFKCRTRHVAHIRRWSNTHSFNPIDAHTHRPPSTSIMLSMTHRATIQQLFIQHHSRRISATHISEHPPTIHAQPLDRRQCGHMPQRIELAETGDSIHSITRNAWRPPSDRRPLCSDQSQRAIYAGHSPDRHQIGGPCVHIKPSVLCHAGRTITHQSLPMRVEQ